MKKIFLNFVMVGLLAFLFTLSATWNSNAKFDVTNFLIFFLIAYAILYFIWKKLDAFKIKNKYNNESILKREFIFYGIAIIIPLIIAILAYYPAIYSNDTMDQWNQVQNNQYNNWHPVMETLVMLKIPSLIYNNILLACIFQCFTIFLILMYFCYFCRKNFLNFKQTLIVLLLIVLNPIFIKYSVTLWKDIIFSWCIFLGTLCLIDISITDGEWIKKISNKILFIIASLGILFFRHNGIIPFITMFIGLIIFYPKKRKFFTISFITILILEFIITGPIYRLFKIDSSTGGKPEMMGVIMGQMTYYYKNQASFTKDELEFLNEIVPLELINKNYNPRNFNLIKWKVKDFNKKANNNFSGLMNLYMNKSIQNPTMFIKSFLNMTSPVWETRQNLTDIDYSVLTYPSDLMNKGKMKNISDNVYGKLITYNKYISTTPLRWLFIDFGQGLFLMIFGMSMMLKNRN